VKLIPPDPYRPPPPTHHGPHGRVRARQWAGTHLDGIRGFLDGPGTVAYWHTGHSPLMRLHLDLEDGRVQTAWPGDWLVWAGDVCEVVDAARFTTDYRPC
jgi:hypothetical protein